MFYLFCFLEEGRDVHNYAASDADLEVPKFGSQIFSGMAFNSPTVLFFQLVQRSRPSVNTSGLVR